MYGFAYEDEDLPKGCWSWNIFGFCSHDQLLSCCRVPCCAYSMLVVLGMRGCHVVCVCYSGLLIIAVVGIAIVVSVTIVTVGVACLCRSVHNTAHHAVMYNPILM